MVSLANLSQQMQGRPSLGIELLSPCLCYAFVSALAFGLPWKLGLKNWKWFAENFALNKYVWWLHGTLTFGLMWLCQPQNLEEFLGNDKNLGLLAVVQHGITSLLALILWDFGYIIPSWPQFLLGCHHAGLFLAMFFGPGWSIDAYNRADDVSKENLEAQVRLDTCMFGWLWMTHSFGFLLQIILPYLFGIKLKEGDRSSSVDAIKHAYSCGSVYLFHQYLNSNSDKLFTYQTSSLFLMLFGRYIACGNAKNVNFLRRIEVPGFFIVLVDRVVGFHDRYCWRSLAIAASLFGMFLVYAVFFKVLMPKPACYFGPKDNPELQKFLEDETDAVRGVSETLEKRVAAETKWNQTKPFFQKSWGNKETKDGIKLSKIYPVIQALVNFEPGNQKDVEDFVNLLDKLGEKALNETVIEHFDSYPLSWSATMQYSYECTLILLKRGGNPYKLRTDNYYAVRSGMVLNSFLLSVSATGKAGALGYSDGFWERFNEICLKKSPPEALSRKEKFLEIVKSL